MEAALDSRIPDGVVDLKNATHVRVIAEAMYDSGISKETINEFVQKFVDEGKHPDRQAFNKEGWLVTFPSKDYRDRALKKGTHSIADPTHGKGGMNLYYKKRGKQKRMTQQDTTATDEPEKTQPRPLGTQPAPNPTQTAAPESQPAPENTGKDEEGNPVVGMEEPNDNAGDDSSEETPDGQSASSAANGSSLPAAGGNEPSAAPAGDAPKEEPTPSAPVAPAPPPEPPYAKLSKEFATQKGWKPTPYGEWRDAQGNAVAVVALSDEIVPIKSVDRDELKLFVDKPTS